MSCNGRIGAGHDLDQTAPRCARDLPGAFRWRGDAGYPLHTARLSRWQHLGRPPRRCHRCGVGDVAAAPCYPSVVSRDLPRLGDDADRGRLGAWPYASYSTNPEDANANER